MGHAFKLFRGSNKNSKNSWSLIEPVDHLKRFENLHKEMIF